MTKKNKLKLVASVVGLTTAGLAVTTFVVPQIFPEGEEIHASSNAGMRSKITGYLGCSDVRSRVDDFLKMHFSYRTFNDELSKRTFTRHFQGLDPGKTFFLASDLESLRKWETTLPNSVRKLDCRFVDETNAIFQKRLKESLTMIDSLLEKPFDFTVDESIETDRRRLEWAKDNAELRERWRKLLKLSAMGMLEADPELKWEEVATRLKRRYENSAKDFAERTPDEKNTVFVNAFASSLDPHSQYMAPADQEEFNMAFSLQLVGIGATLSQQEGYTVVEAVIPGGAASRDGRLKKGDKIVSVDSGDSAGFTDVVDMDLGKVVQLIRGKKGTQVKLVILRKDDSSQVQRFQIDLVRDIVHLKDQAARSDILPINGKKIGVINLPSFYHDYQARRGQDGASASNDVAREIQALKEKKVDGIILDLRSNGGGDLQEAIRITGHFIDRGPVVQVAGPDGRAESLDDRERGTLYAGPLAVLTNKHSASASEIVAGAIQDYGRGLVLGNSRTYGKGTVQNVIEIPGTQGRESNGAIKVTVSKFYSPRGKSNQERGILSDIVIPDPIEASPASEAENDFVLPFSTIAPQRSFKPIQDLSKIIPQLQTKSEKRVQSSEEFKEILEALKKGDESRTSLSLKMQKPTENKPKEPLPAPTPAPGEEGPESKVVDDKDYVLKEAGRILVDSVALVGKQDWTK